VALGCDYAGHDYKERIKRDLEADPRVIEIVDIGVESNDLTPYSAIGLLAGQKVAAGEVDRAILICGTGIGMAISANKVPGVRATVAHDDYSCERSVLSNDCQVLALGERVIGVEVARRLVREWLGYVFDEASPSRKKVVLIDEYERTHPRVGIKY
jgi:ribose 5-phosphate isomerase B